MKCKILKTNEDFQAYLTSCGGVYVLILFLEKESKINVGKLGIITFKKGYYAYVGSAMGGVAARIKTHLNKDKKPHWHIDYLTKHANLEGICFLKTNLKKEDEIACLFEKNFKYIKNFGSSDSKICNSHLFYSHKAEPLFNLAKSFG